MIHFKSRRALALGALTVLALALAGCLLSPGKFASRLELRNDRSFTFTYEGEIYLLALSKLAQMGEQAERAGEEFVAEPCYDDETFEERPCTSEEVAEQEQAWNDAAEAREQKRAQEGEAMRAMLGGIDPASPEAAAELAERLGRQKGWERVVHEGDGLFEVSFRVSGPLEHDFTFPTIERFTMANHFIQLILRDDGTVRLDAPGFAAQAAGSPFRSMMAGMAGAASSADQDTGDMPYFPEIDGTFTLVTDGEILANNTDEGPRGTPPARTLEWRVNARTQSPPMALIRLGS